MLVRFRQYSEVFFGFVEVVVVERVGHAGAQRAHRGALRDHTELHEEYAGAHCAAVLVRVRAVGDGTQTSRDT